MKCPACGKETPDNRSRCVHCGTDLAGAKRLPTGTAQKKPDAPPKQAPPRPAEGTRIVPPGQRETPPSPPRKEPQPKKPVDPGATVVTPGSAKPGQGPPPPKQPADKKPAPEGTRVVPPGAGGKQGQPPPPDKKAPPPPSGEGEPDNEIELLRKALKGRYEITRKLGAGGMANVYHAREIALEREVAIKVLPQSFLRDEQFIIRFKREAQVAANLEHPHIVRIYQIGEEDNLVYFVMSYIPGGAISDRIKKGPIPIDQIVQWGMDVSSALGYAHDHGVIHRDLKPDNIMLDKSGRAVVMDYGIARAAQGTGLTQTGAVIGTPQFMSPEQARGIDLDARSDLYSMGLVLYQMATGTLPFKATDAASLMYMHVHEAPEPPDVRNPEVPAWLRDIILKCLAKNPDDRFSSAKELRLALAEHKAPELTEKTIVQKRAAQKKGAGLWIAAAAVIVIAAAAGWFWWSSQKKAPEQAMTPVQPAPQEQPAPAPAEPQVSADDLAFQQAEMIDTKQAFKTYLDRYPGGEKADEAKAKISEFEEQERLAAEKSRLAAQSRGEEEARLEKERQAERQRQAEAAARQDDETFRKALAANTAVSFTAYLQSYPLGRHVEEARAKIDALNSQAAAAEQKRAEEQAKRDDEAFRMASSSGTKDAYSTYLISFPTGRHAEEARTKIAEFDKRAAFEEKLRLALSEFSITMADIPGGSFQMGSNDGDDNEKPVRTVTVTGFKMMSTEVTQAQYQAIMNDNPSFHKLDENCPVEKVSWKDATVFCNRLSERVGLEPCYDPGSGACDFTKNGFRLPTEAEWEYACRGNTGSEYNTGNGESALDRAGWYARNSREKTHAVAQKARNVYGLYDMHGNVWEWTNDWYDKNSYSQDGTDDPTGPAGGREKVLRGGSWIDWPKDCRSAKRREFDPNKNYTDIGFRVVRR